MLSQQSIISQKMPTFIMVEAGEGYIFIVAETEKTKCMKPFGSFLRKCSVLSPEWSNHNSLTEQYGRKAA